MHKESFLIAVVSMYSDESAKGLPLIFPIKNVSDDQKTIDPSIIAHEIIRSQAMLWNLFVKALNNCTI